MTTAHDARSLRWLPYRRWVEVGFWVAMTVFAAAGNTITVTMEMTRAGLDFHPMEPAIWEWSSNLVILALVPAIALVHPTLPHALRHLAPPVALVRARQPGA